MTPEKKQLTEITANNVVTDVVRSVCGHVFKLSLRMSRTAANHLRCDFDLKTQHSLLGYTVG